VSLAALAAARALDADRRIDDLRETLSGRSAVAVGIFGWCGLAVALAGFLGVIPGLANANAAFPIFALAMLGLVMLTSLRPGRHLTSASGREATPINAERRAA
jgi:hypothetical protein